MRKNIFIFWYFLTFLTLSCGIFACVQYFVDFNAVKSFLDLFSRDGDVASFTLELYHNITTPLLLIGMFLCLVGLFSLFRGKISRFYIDNFDKYTKNIAIQFVHDTKNFISALFSIFPKRIELFLVTSILVYGLIFRLIFINRAIEFDEAYTYIEFAQHSIKWIVSSYYVLNNHIFHTLLVHISTLLFGNDLWAIRLPALTAGVVTIIPVYILGKTLYGKIIGTLSAIMIACAPIQILISTRARGYSIITLLSVLIILLAIYISRTNNKFAWLLLSVLSGIGFYTIPLMLYPLWFTLAWLFLNMYKEKDFRMREWLLSFFSSIFIFSICSFLLYLPVLLNSKMYNAFLIGVDRLPMDVFLSTFVDSMVGIGIEWTIGVPSILGFIVLIGVGFSTIFHKTIKTLPHFPMQIAFILSMTILILIQRPYLIERSTFWMIPFFVIWASAGCLFFINWVVSFIPKLNAKIHMVINSSIIIGIAFLGCLYPIRVDPSHEKWSVPDAKSVTLALKKIISDQDIVVVSESLNAPYWYYFDYYKIPPNTIRDIRNRPFKRAFIIVAPSKQNVNDVVEKYGPDLSFLDVNGTIKILSVGGIDLYEIPGRLDTIKMFFP